MIGSPSTQQFSKYQNVNKLLTHAKYRFSHVLLLHFMSEYVSITIDHLQVILLSYVKTVGY
jgi:hypothetical protein